MIPAILAAPVVGSVVGGVVNNVIGGVANLFSSPGASSSAPASSASFSPYLNNATAANAQPNVSSSPSGMMHAADWNQMSPVDQQTWARGLAGKHVDATDASGRTITGTVDGVQQLGNTTALNIGGHLVSLSQLNQVTWSPSVA